MFVLISMDDNARHLSCVEFTTKEDAWKEMRNELLSVNNNEFKEAYENDCDDNGYVENDMEYGIDSEYAWANADGGDLNCDWRIVAIGNN